MSDKESAKRIEQLRNQAQEAFANFLDGVTYSPAELRAGKHRADHQKALDAIENYEKSSGRKLHSSTKVDLDRAKRFYESILLPDQALNISDTRRYVPEDARIGLSSNMRPGVMGYVSNKEPLTAKINVHPAISSNDPGHMAETLAHELIHTQGAFDSPAYRSKTSSEVMSQIVRAMAKPEFAERIAFGSLNGNSLVNEEEARATLGQMLAVAPKGTTLENIIGEPLKQVIKNNNGRTAVFRTADNKKGRGYEYQNDPKVLMKLIEADMFPKERWIDERPPSIKETIDDFVSKLFKLREPK
jgi:hypothetical protein